MTCETEKSGAEKARKPRGPKPGAGVSGGAQPGAGRPPFVPTDADRKLVRKLSGLGLPQNQIRMLVREKGIGLDTLAEHFRVELEEGKADTSWKIANALYTKAMKGDTTAMIWWTKTQMRWSETQKLEVTGAHGGPIQSVDLSKVSTEALLELSKAISDAAPEDHDGRSRLN
jgi:hypothetical protein